eukprot:scaffold44486_cov46-Attheya_sp.AAC.1
MMRLMRLLFSVIIIGSVEVVADPEVCDVGDLGGIGDMLHWEIVEAYKCEEIDGPRPIHNESTWAYLRGVYVGTVGLEKSTLSADRFASGFQIPFHVEWWPEVGRTVYADADIQKGSVILDSELQNAKFQTGNDFRRFLAALPTDLACDVLMWAYVEEHGASLKIAVDLDEGSFLNSYETPNAQLSSIDGETTFLYYAIEDIDAGEEIMIEYGDFAHPKGWENFGL